MSDAEVEPVYYDLVIVATSPTTDIWLGDDDGHLVQKEIGTLETSLLPGDYTVEFGLGSPPSDPLGKGESLHAGGTGCWADLRSPHTKAGVGISAGGYVHSSRTYVPAQPRDRQ